MRVAVIGTGIAGNAAAWALSKRYPVTVYDREFRPGGHSHTVTIDYDGTPVAARIRDELSRVQVETLERNCEEFGVPVYSLGSEHQGIVHVIGPELDS